MSKLFLLPTLPARFARIIMDLCFAAPRGLGREYPAFPLLDVVRAHLCRLGARFAAIAARAQAGTPRISPRRMVGGPVAPHLSGWRLTSQRRPRALPTGYMWLGKLAPWTCGGGGRLYNLVLADPEMAALIEAAPQVRRILRAILWATCLRLREMPESLRLPPRVRAPHRSLAIAVPAQACPEARRRHYRPSAKWPRGALAPRARSGGKLRYGAGPPLPD